MTAYNLRQEAKSNRGVVASDRRVFQNTKEPTMNATKLDLMPQLIAENDGAGQEGLKIDYDEATYEESLAVAGKMKAAFSISLDLRTQTS